MNRLVTIGSLRVSLLLCIVTLLSVTGAAARQSGFSFGPKAGITLSTLKNMPTEMIIGINTANTMTTHIGFVGGGFVGYRNGESPLGLQVELLYSQQRTERRFSEFDVSQKYRLDYIYVPILVKYYPLAGLNIHAGLQPGFKLNARMSTTRGGSPSTEAATVDTKIDKNVSAADLIIPVGVGYEFAFGLTIDARYNFGVVNIYKNDNGSTVGGTKNNAAQFTVGWKF